MKTITMILLFKKRKKSLESKNTRIRARSLFSYIKMKEEYKTKCFERIEMKNILLIVQCKIEGFTS